MLANNIADEIARIRNTILPSGKRLRDGEILILVRRRDAFAAAMNRALRNRQIPTAGADRIPVSTHIAVLDLLALADVMLLPDDDLQLAALLKSPLLGLSEDELMQLAMNREGATLWGALRMRPTSSVAARRRSCAAGERWRIRSRRSASSPPSSGRTAAGARFARGSAARPTTCSTRS